MPARLEQLGLQLLVAGRKRAALIAQRAGAAEGTVAVALEVAAIEEVGLVAEAAGHPLPTEVVAGRIAIQQEAQEPLRSGLPAHPAPVHHIGRQPHAGVVVQPAGAVQFGDERIHAGQTGAALGDVGRQLLPIGPGLVAGFEFFLIAPDAITQLLPETLPVVAPAEFVDQFFAALTATGAGEHGIAHLRQAEHAMADVRREAGDWSVEEIAPFGVTLRLDACQQLLGPAAAAFDGAQTTWGLWEQRPQLRFQFMAIAELAGQIIRLRRPGQRHAGERVRSQGRGQESG